MVRFSEFFGTQQGVEQIQAEAERHDQSRDRFDHDDFLTVCRSRMRMPPSAQKAPK
jgi:hypothetical protein